MSKCPYYFGTSAAAVYVRTTSNQTCMGSNRSNLRENNTRELRIQNIIALTHQALFKTGGHF